MPKEAEVPPQQGRPEEGDGKAYEPFHLREKIEEMVLYAWEPVTQFPRKDRALSDKLKELMCDLCDLSIQIDNRHMRKGLLEHTESASLRGRLNLIYFDTMKKYGKLIEPDIEIWKGKHGAQKLA